MRLPFVAVTVLLVSAHASPARAQKVCQPAGGEPTVINGALTMADPTQTGRITRDARAGTCVTHNPGIINTTTLHYDAYLLFNTTGQDACVAVDLDFSGCAGNQTMLTGYSSHNPAAPGQNVIGSLGFSTNATGTLLFPVAAGANYTLVVNEVLADTGCPAYTLTVRYYTGCREPGFDLTGDGAADPTLYRPGSGTWYTSSSAGGTTAIPFGVATDVLTPADYTGDGNTNQSVYRTGMSQNTWYTRLANGSATIRQWGVPNDVAVPGDFDRDGRADETVFRPASGTWYSLLSGGGAAVRQFGASSDLPLAGDFDGDLVTDYAVVRPAGGQLYWYLRKTNFAFAFFEVYPFGVTTDKPVPADFDGDGKTDIAVWRPSNGVWYVLTSSSLFMTTTTFQWGANGDTPQPSDRNGDGRADYVVFRPSNGAWYTSINGTGVVSILPWGISTDRPATAQNRVP